MKRSILSIVAVATLVFLQPLATFADSRTYTPPAKTGVIFAVVKYAPYSSRDIRHVTTVSVNWGTYSKSKTYPAPTTMQPTVGAVIRLSHNSKDSVPITVSTNGSVTYLMQSAGPPEWNDSFYLHETWY